MKIIVSQTHEDSCKKAAVMFRELLREKPTAKLGLATGGTPLPLYAELARMNKAGEVDFSRACSVNLDEYCGLAPTHDQSYRYFMDTNLFNHINIDKSHTFVASGTKPPEEAAAELEEKVYEGGAPDLQLLGIGANGHIAFNEPATALVAESHPAPLTESTIDANARFFATRADVPSLSVTMGMKGILSAAKIIMLAEGKGKKEAIEGLVKGGSITTQNPSTFLKLHRDVTVFIDKELADAVGVK